MLLPRNFHVAFSGVVLLSILMSCKFVYVNYAQNPAPPSVSSLKLSNSDISGWTAEGVYETYLGQELYNRIDGGAQEFLDNGMIEAGYLRLSGSAGETIDLTIMDFGSEDNAQKIFEAMRSYMSDAVSLPSFPNISVAAYSPGATRGVAHFGNFYFAVEAHGFADKTQALQTVDMFVRIYNKKTL